MTVVKVFFVDHDPTSDHCMRCGGEQFEGSTGELKACLILERHEDETSWWYNEESLCEKCYTELKENEK